MAYANLTDVSSRLGRAISDSAEVSQVNAWLGDVERIILRRIPDLAARITAGTTDAADVVIVESQSVIRKIKNPDGVTYEAIDDHRQGYNEAMTRGELHLTEDEWDLLLSGSESSGDGAFSITPWPESVYGS